MSIVSEINRINTNIANAYSKCNEKGATMPQIQNSSNLASTIDSISTGGGGSSHDWSAIGYSAEPQEIKDGYDYAVYLKNNYSGGQLNANYNIVYFPALTLTLVKSHFANCINLSSISPNASLTAPSDAQSIFSYCYSLRGIPLIDTSNVTDMRNMFNNCYSLKDLPQLNTSKVQRMSSAFGGCRRLSNASLDNILKMCINVSSNYAQTKTLANIGLSSTYYPAETIQALPSYNDFITAGWTIGY